MILSQTSLFSAEMPCPIFIMAFFSGHDLVSSRTNKPYVSLRNFSHPLDKQAKITSASLSANRYECSAAKPCLNKVDRASISYARATSCSLVRVSTACPPLIEPPIGQPQCLLPSFLVQVDQIPTRGTCAVQPRSSAFVSSVPCPRPSIRIKGSDPETNFAGLLPLGNIATGQCPVPRSRRQTNLVLGRPISDRNRSLAELSWCDGQLLQPRRNIC